MNGLLKDILKEWWVWVILVAGLILFLSSCTRDDMEPRLRKYTVQEGSHDFTPSPFPAPSNAKTFKGQARIHASCWYDVLGVDNNDWNKLAGVYRFADVVKNKNSFILAWRPLNAIKNRFELCLYENIDGANVPHDSAIYQVAAANCSTLSWYTPTTNTACTWMETYLEHNETTLPTTG